MYSKLSKLSLDLLKKMLTKNPDSRITVTEALGHPYFQETAISSGNSINYASPLKV